MAGLLIAIAVGIAIHIYIERDPFKTTDKLIRLGERIRESRRKEEGGE